MPRTGTYSAASYRQWIGGAQPVNRCASSGYTFPLLIPNASDGYTLSELGSAQIGSYPWSIDTGYIKYLINGQGKGIFGTGESGSTSPSRYMLLYDPKGNSGYTYNYYDDCFQPGNPHEMGGIWVDGTLALGGGNEPGAPTGVANSTVRSWQLPNGNIVVLMGNTSWGHAVFQYFSYPGESMVRMQMSYTNTTSVSHNITIQRGGDPDWDQFPSYLGRGTPPVPSSNTVYSSAQVTARTISIYNPGNGYFTNTGIPDYWPLYNPNAILAGPNASSYADLSIYSAWNLGTVNPGETVFVNCYYIVEITLTDFPSYICGEFTPAALPTSATRTCIAVIDECSQYATTMKDSWNNFRASYPNRPFYLLQPEAIANPPELRIPSEFYSNPLSYYARVNRDNGNIAQASDWYSLCNIDDLPDGSSVALWIDQSGSMTSATVRASLDLFNAKIARRRITYTTMTGFDENWVNPFNRPI